MGASETRVENAMSKDIVSVKESESVGSVLPAMAQKGVGSAVVVDDYGIFVGILDGARIVDVIAHSGEESLQSILVKSIVKRQMPRLNPKDSIEEASTIMDDHNLHYLVVVDGREPVGILSHGDIIKWWVKTYGGTPP